MFRLHGLKFPESLEDVHFITSAFPTEVISARFPTLQTITGTRLHVLSLLMFCVRMLGHCKSFLCNHLFV